MFRLVGEKCGRSRRHPPNDRFLAFHSTLALSSKICGSQTAASSAAASRGPLARSSRFAAAISARSAAILRLQTLRELMGETTSDDEATLQVSWEHQPLHANSTWRPIVDLREPASAWEKIKAALSEWAGGLLPMMAAVCRLFAPHSYTIGSHYELEILRANFTRAGWYRCIQRSSRRHTSRISRLFFVDIHSEHRVRVLVSRGAHNRQRARLFAAGKRRQSLNRRQRRARASCSAALR